MKNGISIDEAKSDLDETVALFDSFYNTELVINASEYEIVQSFFIDLTGSFNIAKNFSYFIFRIAALTDKHVFELLDYIKGKNKLEVNYLMAYYLNGVKTKTALYGISNNPIPNQNVQRNIVI